MSNRQLKLDLHPICRNGELIDKALQDILDQAEKKKAKEVEIVCGKGSGQLKKRVLRFLDKPENKERYHRLKKDSRNSGRIFVLFSH